MTTGTSFYGSEAAEFFTDFSFLMRLENRDDNQRQRLRARRFFRNFQSCENVMTVAVFRKLQSFQLDDNSCHARQENQNFKQCEVHHNRLRHDACRRRLRKFLLKRHALREFVEFKLTDARWAAVERKTPSDWRLRRVMTGTVWQGGTKLQNSTFFFYFATMA